MTTRSDPGPSIPGSRCRAAGLALLLGLLAVGVAPTPAAAATPPPPTPPAPGMSPELDPTIIADLSAPEWATREIATERLRRSATLDPGVLISMRAAELPLEARFRLLSACYESYVSAPLGALGVRQAMMQTAAVTGITIQDVIPGFDVARKLRAQDVIHSIDGAPLNDPRSLARAVQRRRPGDVVVVEYSRPRRDGDRIVRDEQNEIVFEPRESIQVTLGSFRSLPSDDWSQTRTSSAVPQERIEQWVRALDQHDSQPRRLALPEAMTAPIGAAADGEARGGRP